MLPLEPSQEKQKLQLKLVLTGNVYFKQTLLKNHNIFISFLAQTIALGFLWKIVKTEEGGISLIQPGL